MLFDRHSHKPISFCCCIFVVLIKSQTLHVYIECVRARAQYYACVEYRKTTTRVIVVFFYSFTVASSTSWRFGQRTVLSALTISPTTASFACSFITEIVNVKRKQTCKKSLFVVWPDCLVVGE